MGRILAGIDYGEASVTLLRAVSALRQRLRATLYLYHAYQIPRGMPFLSAHVIEELETKTQAEAENRLRAFLREHLSGAERRGIRLLVEREFVTEGLHYHLRTERYDVLGIGAYGPENEGEGIGFHARHFIRNAPVPVIITYPCASISWRRMLLVSDPDFALGKQGKVRRLLRRLQISYSGLPMVHLKSLQKHHQKLEKLVSPASYEPFAWEGAELIQVILGAAASVGADTIGILMDPEAIIQGLKATPAEKLHHSPAWVFFPRASQKETESGELSEE
jgi:nucleotide-binding universal stress UspA family protein